MDAGLWPSVHFAPKVHDTLQPRHQRHRPMPGEWTARPYTQPATAAKHLLRIESRAGTRKSHAIEAAFHAPFRIKYAREADA